MSDRTANMGNTYFYPTLRGGYRLRNLIYWQTKPWTKLIELSPLLAIHPFHPRKRGTPALSSSMVSHHSILGFSYWHTLLLQRQRKTIQKLISSVREGRRLEGNVQCSCTLYNVHCSVSADIVYSVFPVCRSVYKQIASLRNLWASGLVRCWQWAFEFSLSCA